MSEEGGGLSRVIELGFSYLSELLAIFVTFVAIVSILLIVVVASQTGLENLQIAGNIAYETMKVRSGAYSTSRLILDVRSPINMSWSGRSVSYFILTNMTLPIPSVDDSGRLRFTTHVLIPSTSATMSVPDWPDCVMMNRSRSSGNETKNCLNRILLPSGSSCVFEIWKEREGSEVMMEVSCTGTTRG